MRRAVRVVRGQRVNPTKVGLATRLRSAMTPAEHVLWRRLRRNQLDGLHFRRQQIIDGFIVDFYCHGAGLVVELDGAVHRGTLEYDADRDRALAARGLRIQRFTNADVLGNIDVVLDRIRHATTRP